MTLLESIAGPFQPAPPIRVVTSYVCPPIPWRDFDWQAWDDCLGADASIIGSGPTEAAAIEDFWFNWEDAQ